MLALFALLVAAGADTAPIAKDLPDADAAALRAACEARFVCAAEPRVRNAIADAARLGLTCAPSNASCWQRFLAAEGFTRVLVAGDDEGARVVALIELDGAMREGRGPTIDAALAALFPAPSPSPPPAPIDRRVGPPTGAHGDDVGMLPFVVAGIGGAVAIATGAAATFVSLDINRSLDEAGARREPLESYRERETLFVALSATTVVAAAAGAIGLGVALLAD